ncbi:sel1 repeat family protein [Caballeronia sp. LZ024]|nr:MULTISPECIES: sel1 repeat family protein [unclassified Caballeronia]MDR5751376.1 sel1 repeat family protein [Caballeronia sp. LZ024]MDR5844482.1 sel1 repeat family protein [Caballeronia sp. LZ031]
MPSPSDMAAVRARLTFTCVHAADHLPSLDPTANELFTYARYLDRQDGPKNYDEITRYYRIAAAYGHYKANNNLQGLLENGVASSPDAPSEAVGLAIQLIKADIPWGYYDMGHYLETGYGVEQDADKARQYFRQAADLGDPDAQYYVGDLLSPRDRAPDISRQMMKCATDQGLGKAASYLGIDLKTDKLYAEAVRAFQRGVEAGDAESASFLENGFNTQPSDPLNYMALPADPERARRYKLIGKFIGSNEGRNPTVSDIDQIVPLPPTKLPPWDGTFQWQKEQDAAQPPQKPAETLVTRLAREKNLDPATGFPLAPAKSAEDERVPLGTVARTGQVCPQDGLWTVKQFADVSYDATRRFRKGETMPQLVMNNSRLIPGLDALLGMRKFRRDSEWTLKAYVEEA